MHILWQTHSIVGITTFQFAREFVCTSATVLEDFVPGPTATNLADGDIRT